MKRSELEFLWKLRTNGLSEQAKARLLKGTGKNGELVNRDYIYALAIVVGFQRANPDFVFTEETTAKDIWLGVPQTERYRLMFYSPCLAYQFDELKEEEQNTIFDKTEWVFTRKYTGIRCVLVCANNEFKVYSRNFSDEDCHCLEYSSKIYQKPNKATQPPYMVDVEMVLAEEVSINDDLSKQGVYPNSRIESLIGLIGLELKDALCIQKSVKEQFGMDLIEFRLIAPIYFNGISYLDKPLGEGMNVYDDCCLYGKNLGLNVKPIGRCEGDRYSKIIFLNTILNEGGEGVVAQNVKGSYNTSEKRSKDSYVKIKHAFGEVVGGLYDTIDAYIGGYKVGNNGLINTLILFVMVDVHGSMTPHLIANLPIGVRLGKELTVQGCDGYEPTKVEGTEDVVSLSYEYYHKVVEINGKGISGTRMVISPVLIRFRDDKSMNECVYSTEWILSQIKEKNYWTNV